jgi:hypothetical protein
MRFHEMEWWRWSTTDAARWSWDSSFRGVLVTSERCVDPSDVEDERLMVHPSVRLWAVKCSACRCRVDLVKPATCWR